MFVFLAAEHSSIVVSIDSEYVACAFTAEDLAKVFKANNVTVDSDIYCSSSVEFASEEGFSNDSEAYEIIQQALALIA
jgi:hypothetical protein